MKLIPIIMRLREKCPSFRSYVGGLAQWQGLDDLKHLAAQQLPAAWVIPAVDAASAPMSSNGCRQNITEGFIVIVASSVEASVRGELAVDALQDVKEELFQALIGLRPAPGYEAIWYQSGGDILAKTGAVMVTRYVFGSVQQFDSGISRREMLTAQDDELMNLPPMNLVHVELDAQPADGRAEAVFEIDFTKLQGGNQ